MTKCLTLCLLAGAALSFHNTDAGAVVSTTAAVACSSTVKLQKRIDAVPAGVVATFVVSGTCTENIVVPEGKTIVIKGKSLAARLVAKNNLQPALLSNGATTLQRMTVSNPGGAADVLVRADHGHIDILASDLTAPKVESVIEVSNASSATVTNSRITGGLGQAVEVTDDGSLFMSATPAQPPGPSGAKLVVSSPAGNGIVCDTSSSLAVRARSSGGSDGVVLISNSKGGIAMSQCSASLDNKTAAASNFTITGIAAGGTAIYADNGTTVMRNITVASNAGRGLGVMTGAVTIRATTIRSNAEGDIWLGAGTTALMPGWDGPSTMPDAFSASKISCFSSPGISTSRLIIDADGLTVPPGKSFGNLADANCVSLP